MTTIQSIGSPLSASRIVASIRDHWKLFLAEGIILVVLGTLAVIVPVLASVAATLLFGWLLLMSGVIGLITSFKARRAPGYWWALLSALIGIAAGVLLLAKPMQGTLSLTIVLIAFLFAKGILLILHSLEHRKHSSGRWGWMLTNGIVNLVLGVILYAGLPGTGIWALGVIVGINLLFGGWTLIMMALHARPRIANVS